jgi:hypothetical protein
VDAGHGGGKHAVGKGGVIEKASQVVNWKAFSCSQLTTRNSRLPEQVAQFGHSAHISYPEITGWMISARRIRNHSPAVEDHMLKNLRLWFVLGAACAGLLSSAWGDTLELKNGSLIKGTYLGGTTTSISFKVGSAIQHYPVADVVSVAFDSSSRTSAAAPAAASQSRHVSAAAPSMTTSLSSRPAYEEAAPRTVAAAPTSVNVPTGTRIMIRTVDAIDSSRNQVGDKFQATLEQPLIVDNLTVAPKGTYVYGRLTEAAEAGRIQGRSQLKLELTGIVVNNQTVPLVTGDYSVTGSSRGATTAKRVGGGAAVGALIGAIAGGGKGAAIGAGIGGGAGTAVQVMSKGERVNVPSETLLEFTIQQDVRIPVSK